LIAFFIPAVRASTAGRIVVARSHLPAGVVCATDIIIREANGITPAGIIGTACPVSPAAHPVRIICPVGPTYAFITASPIHPARYISCYNRVPIATRSITLGDNYLHAGNY